MYKKMGSNPLPVKKKKKKKQTFVDSRFLNSSRVFKSAAAKGSVSARIADSATKEDGEEAE